MQQASSLSCKGKNQLSIRKIDLNGNILEEFIYEGYFDITKRDTKECVYLVKNDKNIFLNGIHVNEFIQFAKKANSKDLVIDDKTSKIIKLFPIYVKYRENLKKYKEEKEKKEILKDIQECMRLAGQLIAFENKHKAIQAKKQIEDGELVEKIIGLKRTINQKKAGKPVTT